MLTDTALELLQPDDVIYYRPYSYRQTYDRYGRYSPRCRAPKRFKIISVDVANHHVKASMKTQRYTEIHNLSFRDLLEDDSARIVLKEKTRNVIHRAKPQYAFSYSDGGKAIATETNDCTVRALALALDAPYEWAHEFMKTHGRKDGHGANIYSSYKYAEYNGKKLVIAVERWNYTNGKGLRMTVNQWIKSGILPNRCILDIPKHVFAVVNGVVMDTWKPGPRTIVKAVWEVVNA